MTSAERLSSITDLPLDILVLVFPYLDVKSFLSLCSTCKAFQQDTIRLDPVYWNYATRSTFRVPNQPVVQHDGALWQKLYRRLQTQSRVFTWGASGHGRLGHPRNILNIWEGPRQMDLSDIPGIIADLQCGGWSTTILTSRGSLHTAGVLNGETQFTVPRQGPGPQPLRFPIGFPYSSSLAQYEEPTIAIRQFSAGRSHILGLSDSGRIWSWYSIEKPALHVKFLDVNLTEASSGKSSPASQSLFGRIKKVVAGWSRSSAYVYGIGIVVWDIVDRSPHENDETDTVLVMQNAEIPRTSYQRPKGTAKESEEERALGAEVGVVLNYIMLEGFVVFVTDIGRVFCGKFGENNQVPEIIELRALRNEGDGTLDVQGSFRRFAVFKGREVITANQDYLEACWNARNEFNATNTDIPGLQRIPALQQGDVISVAFGDYHFLALHSSGKITSYGKELRHCGALGLSNRYLRGLSRGWGDRELVPHAYTHGREVWFQREKAIWLEFLESGGVDPEEAAERQQWVANDRSVAGEVSEWIEQEGRDWDRDRDLDIKDDDGLGAHFALSVSAAGWHSGALVLVNQELEEKVRAKCIVPDQEASTQDTPETGDSESGSSLLAPLRASLWQMGRSFLGLPEAVHGQPGGEPHPGDRSWQTRHPSPGSRYVWTTQSYPRLRLSDGREMPGIVPFNEWKYGRPEWRLDIDVDEI